MARRNKSVVLTISPTGHSTMLALHGETSCSHFFLGAIFRSSRATTTLLPLELFTLVSEKSCSWTRTYFVYTLDIVLSRNPVVSTTLCSAEAPISNSLCTMSNTHTHHMKGMIAFPNHYDLSVLYSKSLIVRDIHKAQSSPGYLQVGQVPSNCTRHIPQTSSSGISHRQEATAFHSLMMTFIFRSLRVF
jgi:hypothetical protein